MAHMPPIWGTYGLAHIDYLWAGDLLGPIWASPCRLFAGWYKWGPSVHVPGFPQMAHMSAILGTFGLAHIDYLWAGTSGAHLGYPRWGPAVHVPGFPQMVHVPPI